MTLWQSHVDTRIKCDTTKFLKSLIWKYFPCLRALTTSRNRKKKFEIAVWTLLHNLLAVMEQLLNERREIEEQYAQSLRDFVTNNWSKIHHAEGISSDIASQQSSLFQEFLQENASYAIQREQVSVVYNQKHLEQEFDFLRSCLCWNQVALDFNFDVTFIECLNVPLTHEKKTLILLKSCYVMNVQTVGNQYQ